MKVLKLPRLIALALAPLLLIGCPASSISMGNRAAGRRVTPVAELIEELNGNEYAFVFLLAGPREGQLAPEELKAADDGHYGHMKRLSEEGVLLIAGRLTDPRADASHRGIFIFDVADIESAAEIAATDPGVQLGQYAVEALPFQSPSDLWRVPDLESQAIAAKELDPTASGPGARPYLLASADATSALPVIEYLEEEGLAFFHGTFGGRLEGRAIVALDALRKDAATTLLDEAGTAIGAEVEWTLHGWFSTESVAALAEY